MTQEGHVKGIILGMDRDVEILRAARKGRSYSSIALEWGISKARVGQIVKEQDPGFAPAPRVAADPKPRPPCRVCGKRLPANKSKYHDECRQAVVALRQVSDSYKATERERFARYCLRHPEKVSGAQRRWAMAVLRERRPATGRRFLRRSSVTYRKLEAAGLLERLPEGIEIID